MLAVFLQGFALSAAMILPLGPQNVFVMNQGIRRQYHLMIASLCALSDIVLICAGIFGGSALLTRSPLLLALVTRAGWRFCCGTGGARSVPPSARNRRRPRRRSWRRAAGASWSPCWRSLAEPARLSGYLCGARQFGRAADGGRALWFALGAVSASAVWFFGLALLASRLAPWLNTQRAQRIINALVGLVMWGIALQLARQGANL